MHKMSKKIISVVVILFFLGQCWNAKIADFIKPCHREQVNLTECVQATANEVIPILIKGVKELNLPPLVDIKLPKISNRPFATYNLEFDGVLESLGGAKYTDSVFDAKNLFAYGRLRFPELKLNGQYKLDGIVGSQPVKGNGTADVILDSIGFEIIWLFSTIKKNGEEYLELTESTLFSYELKKVSYNFENLSSGTKANGTEVNDYLNKNWSLLEDDFTRQVADVVHKISFEVGNLLLDTAPYEEVFPK